MAKKYQQATETYPPGARQRPAFSAHPTRGKFAVNAMAGTSSSILTHKIGGTYAMVGQHPGGSPGGRGKIRDVDFTKVNF